MKDNKIIKGFFYTALILIGVIIILVATAFNIGGFDGIAYILYAYIPALVLGVVCLVWVIYALVVKRFSKIWLPLGLLTLTAGFFLISR